MNILGYLAFIYFVPAICIMAVLGFRKDKNAVAKALAWPVFAYIWAHEELAKLREK